MANPNPVHKFQPGNQHGGRTVGARQRISDRFLAALSEDFDQHAEGCIRTMRAEDNSGYMNMVARLLPKQLEAQLAVQTTSGGFSAEERIGIRGILDAIDAAGAQGVEPAQCFALIEHALRSELAKPIEMLPAPPPLE